MVTFLSSSKSAFSPLSFSLTRALVNRSANFNPATFRSPATPQPRTFHTTTAKMVQEIKTLQEFKELIAEDKVTVIDFHAVWCGPCKAIAPFVQKLSEEHTDAAFFKVDVDEVPDVAQECGIKAMPTFQVFRKGQKIDEVVGASPASIKAAVENHLSS
ncbi:Thioredoxin-1 [Drechslerella dactyloides]|uniref:Thioredoxin-1 n=1 Tax=Drechslerella dactyloides TaxID=74499 RepID=A0AAD6NHR4_DREDA|nr:Thioredoxin-1 [Drechslerella dactyloides]